MQEVLLNSYHFIVPPLKRRVVGEGLELSQFVLRQMECAAFREDYLEAIAFVEPAASNLYVFLFQLFRLAVKLHFVLYFLLDAVAQVA